MGAEAGPYLVAVKLVSAARGHAGSDAAESPSISHSGEAGTVQPNNLRDLLRAHVGLPCPYDCATGTRRVLYPARQFRGIVHRGLADFFRSVHHHVGPCFAISECIRSSFSFGVVSQQQK
jgi:hypothetical protein